MTVDWGFKYWHTGQIFRKDERKGSLLKEDKESSVAVWKFLGPVF